MRCHIFGRPPWRGWRTLSTLLRGPSAAVSMVAGGVGAVLILVPAGAAWPHSIIVDALASTAVLDWVKGSLGLIFLLRRRLALHAEADND